MDKDKKQHPHAEAVYTVLEEADKTFAVKVAIPETSPTTIKPFDSKKDAEDWIEAHKAKIAGRSDLRTPRFFRRSAPVK